MYLCKVVQVGGIYTCNTLISLLPSKGMQLISELLSFIWVYFFIILVSDGKIDNSSDVYVSLISMRTQSCVINDERSASL